MLGGSVETSCKYLPRPGFKLQLGFRNRYSCRRSSTIMSVGIVYNCCSACQRILHSQAVLSKIRSLCLKAPTHTCLGTCFGGRGTGNENPSEGLCSVIANFMCSELCNFVQHVVDSLCREEEGFYQLNLRRSGKLPHDEAEQKRTS